MSDDTRNDDEDEQRVVQVRGQTRAGKKEAFRSMAEQDDDRLIDAEQPPNSWDHDDWEWKCTGSGLAPTLARYHACIV